HRHRLMRQAREHIEPRHARHLNIQKHQVRLLAHDGFECFAPVLAMPNDLNIWMRGEPDFYAATCELFIVDDDRSDRPVTHAIPVRLRLAHAASCAALSAGNDSATRKPGSVL